MFNKIFSINTEDKGIVYLEKGDIITFKMDEEHFTRIVINNKWYKNVYLKNAIKNYYTIEYLIEKEKQWEKERIEEEEKSYYEQLDKGSVDIYLPDDKIIKIKGKFIKGISFWENRVYIEYRNGEKDVIRGCKGHYSHNLEYLTFDSFRERR